MSSTTNTDPPQTWLRPMRQTRLFEDIVDVIEQAIRSGELKPGDRIPSERELAERMAVSRSAVREAIRVLDAMGLVRIDRGAKGIRLSEQAGGTLTRYLRMSLALDHFSLESILEFRMVVESWAARQVALKRPPEIMQELRALIDEMSAPDIDRTAWRGLHWQFHATLARGCENELALTTLQACQEVIASEMETAFLKTNLPQLQTEHAAIFEAIVSGNAELAAQLVGEHIASRNDLPRRPSV